MCLYVCVTVFVCCFSILRPIVCPSTEWRHCSALWQPKSYIWQISHTYIHTHVHTYTHTYTHTHTYKHTHTHTYKHTFSTHIHTYTHTHAHRALFGIFGWPCKAHALDLTTNGLCAIEAFNGGRNSLIKAEVNHCVCA